MILVIFNFFRGSCILRYPYDCFNLLAANVAVGSVVKGLLRKTWNSSKWNENERLSQVLDRSARFLAVLLLKALIVVLRFIYNLSWQFWRFSF